MNKIGENALLTTEEEQELLPQAIGGDKKAQKLTTEAVLTALDKAGVEVIETTPEMVEGVVGEEVQSHKKLSAPETASVQEEHQPTVVSSTDGAKVLKEIDPAIEGYENKGNRAITIKKRINGVSVVATIEKCALINNLNGLSNTVAENQNTSLWGKDTKLISLLQTNSSKVVDENGLPLVISSNETTVFGKGANSYSEVDKQRKSP